MNFLTGFFNCIYMFIQNINLNYFVSLYEKYLYNDQRYSY